jgi:hypothetical protein
MTYNTKEQRMGPYETLVSQAQDLSARVCRHKGPSNFDDFVAEHNTLLKKYIAGFTRLSVDERESAACLLNTVKSLMHGTLDVYRVREMRTVVEQPPENMQTK